MRSLFRCILIGLVTCATGCGADPVFVASEVDDMVEGGDADVTGDLAEVMTDADAVASDVAPDGDDAVSEVVEDVPIGPGCGTGCGPVAECVEEACTCIEAACTGTIVPDRVAYLAVAQDAADVVMVAYGREVTDDIGLASWDGTAWTIVAPVAARHGPGEVGLARDGSGAPWILQRDADDALHIAHEGLDGWRDDATGTGPCGSADLTWDSRRAGLVSVCVDTDIAVVSVLDLAAATSTFMPRAVDPLNLGADHVASAWALAPSGVLWLAWIRPAQEDGNYEVRLAYLGFESWTSETIAIVREPGSIDLAIDSENGPHVFVAHTAGLERLVTHGYYADAVNVVLDVVARKSGASSFARSVVAAPATGQRVHLAYTDTNRLVWLDVERDTLGAPAAFELGDGPGSIAISADALGRPTVVFVTSDGRADAWLPAGL